VDRLPARVGRNNFCNQDEIMSFSIATSGLNAISQQLGAISNNIANTGTVGYKSGRAEFAALYAQSQPLGVGVTGVTQSITRGGNIISSSNSLDLAISGNGFFVVRDSTGTTSYTRAGYFGTDKDGNLVNNLGMNMQGYPVDANGNLQVRASRLTLTPMRKCQPRRLIPPTTLLTTTPTPRRFLTR
jgi:flagellar hook-basal body protein